MTPKCTAGKSIGIRFFPRMTALEIVLCVGLSPFMLVLWIVAKTAQGLFAAGRWVWRLRRPPMRDAGRDLFRQIENVYKDG
jgi:hypothetical protein